MPTVTGLGNAPSHVSTPSSEVESFRISARIAPDSSSAHAVAVKLRLAQRLSEMPRRAKPLMTFNLVESR